MENNNNNNSVSSQPGDTIHIAHYKINIDTINYSAHTIKAHAELSAVAKVNNVNTIYLSLLELNIDSVFVNNLQVFYVYNDTTLTIPTITTLNTGDTAHVKVYYNGAPQTDASGWGGFYFSGTFAFNLGVGFAAIPHNLGRVWFPCIDNFTDKATYEFYINTPSTYKAFCNGELISETLNANGTKTWYWKINHPIPTYLACMAAAPFYTLDRTSNGIPVQWACLPADTVNTLNTFQNLDTVLSSYINAYGPYPWNKVGYLEVPFNSGAMEHATAITIGRAFINGSLTYETLWAHELSHMWWGDMVTCKTAADMWLNEGFATFNEAFTTEHVYGLQAYKNWIRPNHHRVVQFAHVPQNDGAYLTMNNIPETNTYGFTVYQKGADLVHTLRNYMGDSLFFAGSQYYMNQFAYGNADSYDLRDALTAGSGMDMTRFFDDWVFTPGFPQFSIDSVIFQPGGLDHYFVYTRQRSRGNPNHIYSMPVEITFANDFMDTTVTIQIDSATQMFHIPLIGIFSWVALDRNEKISDANVDFEKIITAAGTNVITETNVTLNVLNPGTGTNTVRVENNYVLPDGFKQSNPGIRLSDYHYWKVDGIFSQGFLSEAQFYYDGSTSATSGYLDNTLITGVEDSLVLLYRQGTWDDWHLINGDSLAIFAANDKRGQIIIDTLKIGEYVLGYYDHTVGTSTISSVKNYSFSVQPNPSSSVFNFYFDLSKSNNAILKIFDARGTTVVDTVLKSNQTSFAWNANNFSKGTYFGALSVDGKKVAVQKIVLME
ncbi:MAG TPA: M1 family aminopeptidase [Bacteroidia bacterium]|nr:M1 family aminopeptidase [Bacteroidia bacterium]